MGHGINGRLERSDQLVVYTEAYMSRYRSRIRGFFNAATHPVAVASVIERGDFQERLFLCERWWACAGPCGGRVVEWVVWWVVGDWWVDRCTCDMDGLFWFEECLPSHPLPLPHPSAILNDLVASGEVGGVLHGRGDRAVFTPHIYSRAQNSWVDAFYSANGYLGEHASRWA